MLAQRTGSQCSSFTFSDLCAGRYDFYFVSVCLSGTSTGIGIEDVCID